MQPKNVAIVVAHADDETLRFGGTILMHSLRKTQLGLMSGLKLRMATHGAGLAIVERSPISLCSQVCRRREHTFF